jgi:hypothetical protein
MEIERLTGIASVNTGDNMSCNTKWTKDKPSKSGWYWAKRSKSDAPPYGVVGVDDDLNFYISDDVFFNVNDDFVSDWVWSGEIKPPCDKPNVHIITIGGGQEHDLDEIMDRIDKGQ